MTLRVLITGFGPFPGAPFNPTAQLVARLAKLRRPALDDIERTAHIFRVTYGDVDRDLPRLLAERTPDVLLMFGLAARTPQIRIETRARNLVSFFPDAGGFVPTTRKISAGASDRRLPPALAIDLLRAARSQGLDARFSRDAGRYVCNYAFWRALEISGRDNKARTAAFIHIPSLRRPAAKRSGRRRPSLADLTRTGSAILQSLLAAHRRMFIRMRG